MSRWMHTLTMLAALFTLQLLEGTPAEARVSQAQLSRLRGRIVLLQRQDGRWLLARILRVDPNAVTVELSDGLSATIPLVTLAAVRRQLPHEPPSTSTTAVEKPHPKPPHKLRVEWVGLRAGIGGVAWTPDEGSIAGFGELTLFTLHYRHFYWEILRVGGGMPHLIHWGTALGYPFHLDDDERHQLRLGVHISFWFGLNPVLSGLQLYYVYRSPSMLAIQVGIMQTSYPFSVTAIVGISM